MKKRLPLLRLPLRVWFALLAPFILLGVGTLGYKLIGGAEWTWGDAAYMSGITLTTVGYGETRPLDGPGRVFTVFYLFTGVFSLFYAATETIRSIVTGQLRSIVGREGVKHQLEAIRDHVIVCGLGRMGRLICREFDRKHVKYAVIDQDPQIAENWSFTYGIPVHGDATDDEVLHRAGIQRAKTLIAVLPSDADNLYITLTGRVLNEKLTIVARAEQEESEAKLRRVGANHVVSPYVIGGHRVAQAVLQPTVGHFFDQAGRAKADYQLEEIEIQKTSALCGKTIREANLRDAFRVVVIALRHANGEIVFSPKGDSMLETSSVLVAAGRREDLDSLQRLAAGL
jgi:voltage-gated potassium channel